MNRQSFFQARRPPRRERGQATILALGALIFLTVMTLGVFNVQQASHSKQKVMNAADGGAYAAASTLARDMNYMAYTNRAMVANHVAVGQVVSLVSLTQSLGQLSRNAATAMRVVGLVPGLQGLQGLATALERLDNLTDRLPPLMTPFIAFETAIIEALSLSQSAVRLTTVVDAKSNLEKVIRANDARAIWDTSGGGLLASGASLEAFVSYSRRYDTNEADTRFRNVVNDSRDNFTRDRRWLIFRGGSNMRENNETWTGLDGAEINLFLTRIYLSWGGAETGTRTWNRGNQSYGGLARRTANRAFNARQTMNGGYRGIRPYFDLRNQNRNDDLKYSPTIVVAASKPLNRANDPKSQLSDSALGTGQADGAFRLPTGRNNAAAVAASQVYFHRPYRNYESVTDAQHLRNRYYSNGEYANLFSPYWQARLTDVPAAALVAIQALD